MIRPLTQGSGRSVFCILIPKRVILDPFDGDKSVHSVRVGVKSDAAVSGKRCNDAEGRIWPSKARLFCARWSSVTPHLWSIRARPWIVPCQQTQKAGQMSQGLLSLVLSRPVRDARRSTERPVLRPDVSVSSPADRHWPPPHRRLIVAPMPSDTSHPRRLNRKQRPRIRIQGRKQSRTDCPLGGFGSDQNAGLFTKQQAGLQVPV